jgi:hypothetical protein
MKKILFALLLISSAASAQLKFTGNRLWNLNRYRLSMDSGSFRIPRFTTVALPAGGAGDIVYNVDSNKIFFYNGSGWINPANTGGAAYTAGSGHTLTGTVFKAGGVMSENLSFDNVNTYTWQIENAGTQRLHVKANGNVVVGGTSDGGGYKFFVNGIGGFTSGGAYWVFNGTDIQYFGNGGTAAMKVFGGSSNRRWDWTVNNSGMTIAPQTDNTLPFLITDNASVTRLQIDFSTPKTTITSALSLKGIATAPSTYNMLVRNLASDSMAYQITPLKFVTDIFGTPAAGKHLVSTSASTFAWQDTTVLADFTENTTNSLAFTYVTNTSATSSVQLAYYKSGNNITFYGTVTVIPTAGGAWQLDMAFPISSAITSAYMVAGTGACSAFPTELMEISGDATNDRFVMKGNASNTTTRTYYIHGTYRYIAP